MNTILKKVIFLFLLLGSTIKFNAQSVGINNSGSAPDASAMFDVQSTEKGILIPRMNSTQRIQINPAADGLLVFDTQTSSFWFRNGSAWVELISGKIAELSDEDGDTKVQVEEGPNDNTIRFDVGGDESMVLNSAGELAIKGSGPDDPGFIQLLNSDSSQFVRLFSGRSSDTNPFFGWELGSPMRFVGMNKDYSGFSEHMRIEGDGNVGIGESLPLSKLHVGGGFLFEGENGTLPVEGAGVRMMWVPSKRALRVGEIFGLQWNLDSIGTYSTVAGGVNSKAKGDVSFVGGGDSNWASGFASTVGGGYYNRALGQDSHVGGGSENVAKARRTFVGGGFSNIAIGDHALVTGGSLNIASGNFSALGGGLNNEASGDTSVIFGGARNSATAVFASSVGGAENTASGNYSFVGGGQQDTASGDFSFVGSGRSNIASRDYSIVIGGFDNAAIGVMSSVGGGNGNMASGYASHVGGGYQNKSLGQDSHVGGGSENAATAQRTFVGGGLSNIASGDFSILGGGFGNITSGIYSVLGGGNQNTASGGSSFVGGGIFNNATGDSSVVVGGLSNTANGVGSFVGGGFSNLSNADYSFVAGGFSNKAYGYGSTISGGNQNNAYKYGSTVLGGEGNKANGDFSTVGGKNNSAESYGETVFGFFNSDYDPNSTAGFIGSDRLFVIGNGTSTVPSNAITILKNGNMGVGEDNPTKAKLEVDGTANDLFTLASWIYEDTGGAAGPTPSLELSGHFSHNVAAESFVAFSDVRIKKIKGISSADEDLKTIMGIEITDYCMKDSLSQGNKQYKKVMAQQVKEVYPQAVSSNLTDVIPDIYQRADVSNEWISLKTDLKVGERVKLITDQKAEVYEVTQVRSSGFQVKGQPLKAEKVFVYGREVNDFHTVDYEAISMLNVSATQAQQKLIEENEAEIKELKDLLKKQNGEMATIKELFYSLKAEMKVAESIVVKK